MLVHAERARARALLYIVCVFVRAQCLLLCERYCLVGANYTALNTNHMHTYWAIYIYYIARMPLWGRYCVQICPYGTLRTWHGHRTVLGNMLAREYVLCAVTPSRITLPKTRILCIMLQSRVYGRCSTAQLRVLPFSIIFCNARAWVKSNEVRIFLQHTGEFVILGWI